MIITKNYNADVAAKIRALYEAAFPASEKKPFALMEKKRDEGFMELCAILSDEDEFLGLAFFILHGRIALLDYFAIDEDARGRGVGTEALAKIKELFQKRVLLLEIEDTDEKDAENIRERIRRRSFYERGGMEIMPFKVMLFGVKMHILTFAGKVNFEEYHRIFTDVFGAKAAEKVNLI